MRIITIICCLFSTVGFAQIPNIDDKKAVLEVMQMQEECWNKADVDCFMKGYWRSDSLRFIGASGITYGWQQTLDNYKKRYPDAKTMGKLTFDIVQVDQPGEMAMFVTGKWHLTREAGDVGGYFTLLWRKIDGKWKIVADHTS